MGETLENVSKGMDTYSYKVQPLKLQPKTCNKLQVPLGVCAGIAPFNFPAMIPLWMFPVALVSGTAPSPPFSVFLQNFGSVLSDLSPHPNCSSHRSRQHVRHEALRACAFRCNPFYYNRICVTFFASCHASHTACPRGSPTIASIPASEPKTRNTVHQAGVPKGVLNVIHGTHDCVNFICDNPTIKVEAPPLIL